MNIKVNSQIPINDTSAVSQQKCEQTKISDVQLIDETTDIMIQEKIIQKQSSNQGSNKNTILMQENDEISTNQINGVFEEELNRLQSNDQSFKYCAQNKNKQLFQDVQSNLLRKYYSMKCKLSSHNNLENSEIQNDNNVTYCRDYNRIRNDQLQQLQDQILTKKIDFQVQQNMFQIQPLSQNQSKCIKQHNEIQMSILSPQPTKYQKISRNYEDRGHPICTKVQDNFQIEESFILRANQNILNIPSKNKINIIQKINADSKNLDRQEFSNSQNIDYQICNKNSRQFERNGKNFILKKQTHQIQKLFYNNNFQGEQNTEKQRLNQSKNIFEMKKSKVELQMFQKNENLNINQDSIESHMQSQEIIAYENKNNEENQSHKSNSNRKSDHSVQNQGFDINAFSFQSQNDNDDQKINLYQKPLQKKQFHKQGFIQEKSEIDKQKLLQLQEDDTDMTESYSNIIQDQQKDYKQDTFTLNNSYLFNANHKQKNTSDQNENTFKNTLKEIKMDQKIKSPQKNNNLLNFKIKTQSINPTDPQALRLIRKNDQNLLIDNQIKKICSSHESNSTKDFSRASDLQQINISTSNQVTNSETYNTNQNGVFQIDNIFDYEETNGYNHSFINNYNLNENCSKYSNDQFINQQFQPQFQKMKSQQDEFIFQNNDLLLPQNQQSLQQDFSFQNFNIQSIGDGLLQQHNYEISSEKINQSLENDQTFKKNKNYQIIYQNQQKTKLIKKVNNQKNDNILKSNQNNKQNDKLCIKRLYYDDNSMNQNNFVQEKEQKNENKLFDDDLQKELIQREFEDQSQDRFIPYRMNDEACSEIFDISKQIIHEQALVNKLCNIQKLIQQENENQNQIQTDDNRLISDFRLQSMNYQQLNNRGLFFNDVASTNSQSNQFTSDQLLSTHLQQNAHDISTQIENNTNQDTAQSNSDFNNNFFDIVLQRRASQRQQESLNQNLGLLLQQVGVQRPNLANDTTLLNQLNCYNNIFGVQNSYDQVIKQVSQNVICTNTLPKVINQNINQLDSGINQIESDFEILNQSNQISQNAIQMGNSITQNNHKNHAQEEKDLELNKNISNYNNLIEQNLLLKNVNNISNQNNGIQNIDQSASQNLYKTNLTTDCNDQIQGIPFSMKSQDQDLSNKNNNNGAVINQKNSNLNSQNQILQSQKSILGGKILKFNIRKSYPSTQNLESKNKNNLEIIQENICQKYIYDYDFNMNGLINCDQIFLKNTSQNSEESVVNTVRKIPSNPYRILDAPGLCDDFYLNLVDWSSQNLLAVALESSVYVWNATTSTVSELCDLGQIDQVTSLSWSQKGSHLSVGTKSGQVQIWDINYKKKIRSLEGHFARVSSLAWNNNNTSVVASGSKDRSILLRDLRQQNNQYMKLMDHKQEVCGLRWSLHDENQLASGGNDNQLFIWSANSDQPLAKFSDHQAAVKAINWSPLHRGLLATGGGTADQCIRFWNTINLSSINCINTGSQVCNLVFSKTNDELVSTHGYSLNQVIVWKYPSMEKIATLTGHTFRVLYLAMNPDGSSIVTGAGDERLRFWNIFPKARSSKIGPLGGLNVVGSVNSSLYPSNLDMR